MKPYLIENLCLLRTSAWLTLGAVLLVAIGCHTAEGVKQDAKSALDATGKELQKGAAKIDGSDKETSNRDVKKDTQSPN